MTAKAKMKPVRVPRTPQNHLRNPKTRRSQSQLRSPTAVVVIAAMKTEEPNIAVPVLTALRDVCDVRVSVELIRRRLQARSINLRIWHRHKATREVLTM
ncbi:hypothetical protein V5799_000150 [Amblyomma americanum]|uniref:Uncharacterized protein n=1 Tax=Amblyomma americanum TaxID=6943 RepID=A0AAQ4D3V8_AMBAM